MQRKTFRDMQCPIARSLERVGEWWSILILREAGYGTTRFDDFQRRLEIAPNMLTRRLNALVEEGLLARRQYSDRPPRFEYVLTDAGRDFRPVLWALLAWGNRHFAPEGISAQLIDRQTGQVVEPVVVDAVTGHDLVSSPDGRFWAFEEHAVRTVAVWPHTETVYAVYDAAATPAANARACPSADDRCRGQAWMLEQGVDAGAQG